MAFGNVCVGVLLALSASGQPAIYYRTGNIREARGVVATDKGEEGTTFSGMVGFKVIPSAKGLQLVLIELNLVSKGVPPSRGPTGTLGLNLIDDVIAWYAPRARSGSFSPRMTLPYALIHQLKGLQAIGTKGEDDAFIPFTESMVGKLAVPFPEGLQVREKGSSSAEMELSLDLSSSVFRAHRRRGRVLVLRDGLGQNRDLRSTAPCSLSLS